MCYPTSAVSTCRALCTPRANRRRVLRPFLPLPFSHLLRAGSMALVRAPSVVLGCREVVRVVRHLGCLFSMNAWRSPSTFPFAPALAGRSAEKGSRCGSPGARYAAAEKKRPRTESAPPQRGTRCRSREPPEWSIVREHRRLGALGPCPALARCAPPLEDTSVPADASEFLHVENNERATESLTTRTGCEPRALFSATTFLPSPPVRSKPPALDPQRASGLFAGHDVSFDDMSSNSGGSSPTEGSDLRTCAARRCFGNDACESSRASVAHKTQARAGEPRIQNDMK